MTTHRIVDRPLFKLDIDISTNRTGTTLAIFTTTVADRHAKFAVTLSPDELTVLAGVLSDLAHEANLTAAQTERTLAQYIDRKSR